MIFSVRGKEAESATLPLLTAAVTGNVMGGGSNEAKVNTIPKPSDS